MAYEIPGFAFTLPASANLSTFQYTFVTVDAAGEAGPPATTGEAILGVLQNKPTVQGQAASIMVNGISKITAPASTLAEGDLCEASTAGQAIPLAAGGNAVGRIVSGSSGGAGRVLSVLITPYGSTAIAV